MPWLQFKTICTAAAAPALEELLLTAGALAITLEDAKDDPIFEPPLNSTPLWPTVHLIALFPSDTQPEALATLLKQHCKPMPFYETTLLADQAWETLWMEHYQALQFGNRLWLYPTWQQLPDNLPANQTLMRLNPGIAFGTGTHPTTHLCLEWLTQQKLLDTDLIDYGCGSGILGIAASLLGCRSVSSVDIDPQALAATIANCQHNNLAVAKLQVYAPHELPLQPKVDILIANILANPLLQLHKHFSALIKVQGLIALSGILATQVDTIREIYQENFTIKAVTQREDWALIWGIKKY